MHLILKVPLTEQPSTILKERDQSACDLLVRLSLLPVHAEAKAAEPSDLYAHATSVPHRSILVPRQSAPRNSDWESNGLGFASERSSARAPAR